MHNILAAIVSPAGAGRMVFDGDGGGSGGEADRDDPRQGRGYNTDYSQHPGYRGDDYSSNSGGGGGEGGGGSFTSGSAHRGDAAAQVADMKAAGRGSYGDLRQADNRAVEHLGSKLRSVNRASLAFNEGPSADWTLDAGAANLKDSFGVGAPGGFAKSGAANAGLGILGSLLGGPLVGAGLKVAHSAATAPPGHRNNIGLLSGLGSAIPGPVGLASSGINLVDKFVDLDGQGTGSNPSAALATRNDLLGPADPNAIYPGGGQGRDTQSPSRGLLSGVTNAGTSTAPGNAEDTPSNSSNVGLVSNAAGENLPTPGERFRGDRYLGGRWVRNQDTGQLEWVANA